MTSYVPQATASLLCKRTLGTKGCAPALSCTLRALGDCSDYRYNIVTNQFKVFLVNLFFLLKVHFLFLRHTKSRPNWNKKETKRPPNKLFIWKQCSWFTVCRQSFCLWWSKQRFLLCALAKEKQGEKRTKQNHTHYPLPTLYKQQTDKGT